MRRIGSLFLVCVLAVATFVTQRASATSITISSTTVANWQYNSPTTLRIYVNSAFFDSDGLYHPTQQVGGPNFYYSATCSLSGTTLTIPAIALPSTTNSGTNPNATYSAVFFVGNTRRDNWLSNFRIPISLGTPVTWSQIAVYNSAGPIPTPVDLYYTRTQVDLQIISASQGLIQETPSGLVNGVNQTFVLARTPIANSELAFLNGQLQTRVSSCGTASETYSISGTTITHCLPPQTGDSLVVTYKTAAGLINNGSTPMQIQAGDGTILPFGAIIDRGYLRRVGSTIVGVIPSTVINVKSDYAAVGNGVADDTAAVNSAIAALNAAGGGVLYFPKGLYKTIGPLTTLTADFRVVGDGQSPGLTKIICTSPTAVLFTSRALLGSFSNLILQNTAGSTPSAGAAIVVSHPSLSYNKVDLENVGIYGFYDNVDYQVGAAWSIHNCSIGDAVRYGIRIRNLINADAGDWSISNTTIYQSVYPAVAGIQQDNSGGGKIVNLKINGGGTVGTQFQYGIRLASSGTIIFNLSNLSIENVTNIGFLGTGLPNISIANAEFGMYTAGGYAIDIENTDQVAITNVSARGFAAGLAAFVLQDCTNVDVGTYNQTGFGANWQVTGAFSGKLIPGESTLGALAISSNAITPIFQVSHVGAGLLRNIAVPDTKRAQTACFIPDAAFTYDNAGNILGSGTAVIGRTVCATFSPSAAKWSMSY